MLRTLSFFFIFCLFTNTYITAQVQHTVSGNEPGIDHSYKPEKNTRQTDQTDSVVFTSSNLPIIIINTNNQTIPDSPKIPAQMGIIYNGEGVRNYMTDPLNNYNNKIGIEVRGSTSQSFPQKSYSIETRDVFGVEHDTVVLGMPAENSWILYAPYDDKTCMRNTLTFDIANKTGHYASRSKFCELVLNGHYMGIYVWMEKIKRDGNRVNISKLEVADTTGDNLSGGYIIKIDKPTGEGGNSGWNSSYQPATGKYIHFLYEYPKDSDIVIQQKNYIKAYVDSFEVALKATNFADPINGYRKYMDVNSFIDYLIINEASRNVDGYRLSTFLYKDRSSNGGKLFIGPVWDYNIAWWNANYCSGNLSTGWAYNFNSVCTDTYMVPFWWTKFMQDTNFKNSLKCRWTELRQTVLSISSIYSYIDTIASRLNEAQSRHFVKWPILGIYTWPNPTPYATTYAGEITAIKTWIQNRMNWLDANMPGNLSYPLVNLGNDTSVCPGQFVLNAGNTGCSYLWNTGANSQTLTVNSGGIYSVTVNNNGCKKSDTVSIILKPIPNAFAGNDTSICQGNSISLTATGGVSYLWNNGILQSSPFYPNITQFFTVTVSGSNACTSKDSVKVSIINLPPKPLITVKYGIVDTLISNVAIGNQWYQNGNILMGENGQKLLVSSLVNADYTDIVTENGCSSSPSDIISIVNTEEYTDKFSFVVFPNPFKEHTSITYTLKMASHINISFYDVTGREIKILQNSIQEKGAHHITFDAAILKPGIYFYTVKTGEDTYTGKVVKMN